MNEGNSEWISFSDIMTTLMLIFLLISILTISQIQSRYKEPLIEFVQIKEVLYNDLKKTFESKEQELEITIGRDLSVKFSNTDTLFDQDSVDLKDSFKKNLDIFLPLYLDVINKPEYKDNIKEVRIEGHTAEKTSRHNTDMALIELSQGRSNSVLGHMWANEYYNNKLSKSDREKLFFWFSSNGFGKGKAIDDNGEYVHNSRKDLSAKSRRVEFKLITKGEELINEILEVNNK